MKIAEIVRATQEAKPVGATHWEAQRRNVLHPLEYTALLTAERRDGPQSHALVALLGMLRLRVSEACRANVTDLSYRSGYKPPPSC